MLNSKITETNTQSCESLTSYVRQCLLQIETNPLQMRLCILPSGLGELQTGLVSPKPLRVFRARFLNSRPFSTPICRPYARSEQQYWCFLPFSLGFL